MSIDTKNRIRKNTSVMNVKEREKKRGLKRRDACRGACCTGASLMRPDDAPTTKRNTTPSVTNRSAVCENPTTSVTPMPSRMGVSWVIAAQSLNLNTPPSTQERTFSA